MRESARLLSQHINIILAELPVLIFYMPRKLKIIEFVYVIRQVKSKDK